MIKNAKAKNGGKQKAVKPILRVFLKKQNK